MMSVGKRAEVRRDGDVVTIAIRCKEIYEAMQLYDELIVALEQGYLNLAVRAARGKADPR